MSGEFIARLTGLERMYNLLMTRMRQLEETVRQLEQQMAELRGSLHVG